MSPLQHNAPKSGTKKKNYDKKFHDHPLAEGPGKTLNLLCKFMFTLAFGQGVVKLL